MSLDIYNHENLEAYQIELKNKILFDITNGQHIGTIEEIPRETTVDKFFILTKNLVDQDERFVDRRVLVTDTMSENNIMQDPDDPTKDLSGMVITSLLHRAPATLVGGNEPFDKGRRDIKPKRVLRLIKNTSERPGEVTYVINQWFDNLIGFNVGALTNKRADELADWFENLMETNRWYFELNGYGRYNFDERTADLYVNYGTYKMAWRPHKYYVRTETNYLLTEQQLNKLIVQITTEGVHNV